MSLADRLTFSRLILAPIFFVAYMLPIWFPRHMADRAVFVVVLCWVIFIISELTDMFDGMAARKLKQSSNFGRLLDPFADTLMQLSCFLCFVIDGIFPAFLFLVVLYREFGILFLRNLMLQKGVSMGARNSGKIKTVSFIIAAITALIYASLSRLGLMQAMLGGIRTAVLAIFSLSVCIAVLSFFDYYSVYRKTPAKPADTNPVP